MYPKNIYSSFTATRQAWCVVNDVIVGLISAVATISVGAWFLVVRYGL
jgi:hypothetical protein